MKLVVEVGMAILDGNTFLYCYPYFNHQFYSVVFMLMQAMQYYYVMICCVY